MKNIYRKIFKQESRVDTGIGNTFLSGAYQKHNVARLGHLDSLGLPLRTKRVFEFGAGIGDHSYYFLTRGCQVTASDSRPELLTLIKNRFGIPTLQLDIENDLSKIKDLPFFDVMYCYGVLYHISNPVEFIKSLAGKCDIFLLETCVSHDLREPGPHLVTEDLNNPTQASSGTGCRPTRDWIFRNLKEVFPYVYLPKSQPEHEEFPKDWTHAMEDRSKLIRAVFIASTSPLDNTALTQDLIKVYH